MRSFELGLVAAMSVLCFEAKAEGFLADRVPGLAPGSEWMVVDDVRFPREVGGALGVTLSGAHDAVRVTKDGVGLVSDLLLGQLSAALHWDRLRFSVGFSSPLLVSGRDALGLTAPRVTLESNPDTLSDVRVGLTVRVWGDPEGAFKLGLSGDVFVPSGVPEDFVSDGTWRGKLNAIASGSHDVLAYAVNVGVHVRPLDTSWRGGARGSELTWAAGLSLRRALGESGLTLSAGPELFGATALRAAFASDATGLEWLFGARLEGRRSDGGLVRVKIAGGSEVWGAASAAWRVLLTVELSGVISGSAPTTRFEPPPHELH